MQSPCIGHCVLENNVCQGCGRTAHEITTWSRMTEEERRQVMERVADNDDDMCPRCGHDVPSDDGKAPCLCPQCGARICEGTV